MQNTILIFIGSGLGGICRYWISNSIYFLLGKQFPYGTMVVNVTGCLLMGILFVLTLERFNHIAPIIRALLLIGFLGGYTTFSSFSIETITLFENGNGFAAGMNIFLSVIVCLAATGLGIKLGRML